MRFRLLGALTIGCVAAVVASLSVNGCGLTEELYLDCNPEARKPDPDCVDAGSDAESDAQDDAAQARCTGQCVEGPRDEQGALWSERPLLFWEGPTAEAPTECPDDGHGQLDLRFVLYRDLVAPPVVCDECKCEESVGVCNGIPTGIEVRAGTCMESGVSSMSFDGPTAWDGSCTTNSAISAGAECPIGSGNYCAQSISVPTIPKPTSESCKVIETPVPKFAKETSWLRTGIACGGEAPAGVCDPDSRYCVRALPLPWMQCIWRAGEHKICPSNYSGSRFVMYGGAPDDSRKCTGCECGPPQGSACNATLRLYGDDACASQSLQVGIGSDLVQCTNFIPPGEAIGSKAITDLAYEPGTCQASGGMPTGEAEPNPETAVTFCCLPLFDIE